MRKHVLSVILALCICLCLLPIDSFAADNAFFIDVKAGDWFYEEVQYVNSKGLMSGIGNSEFHPNGITTRGMLVTVLYRLEQSPAVNRECPFADVAAGSYYEYAITWASENGIVSGYNAQRFGPNDTITREQMAAVLYRYADYKGFDVSASADLSKYVDESKISDYAKTALSWANAAGLVSGVSATTLSPDGNATRAQIAAILTRFCKKFVDHTCTVTFLRNTSEPDDIYQTIDVEFGQTVVAPEDPVQSDYIFNGWYTEAENGSLFDFSTPITSDICLYARWDQAEADRDAQDEDDKPLPEGIDAANIDESASNIFKLSAQISDDKKTIDVTLTLCGGVSLCGFDMKLLFDEHDVTLSNLDTDCDLQVFASEESPGAIAFNYANAKNITKTKTVLKGTFRILNSDAKEIVFSLKPVEVIKTDSRYEVVPADYTITYITVAVQ